MKFYKILFFNFLIFGTLMAISSLSWFSMWIGLEINLLAIIPLMCTPNNIYSAEAAMKYFITQSMASMILLFSIILMSNFFGFLPQTLEKLFIMSLNSSLLLKMGAAPFHAWFPEVMEGLNWVNCFIMLTWQKIAPMVLLMYNLNMGIFFNWIIILSSMIGGVLGFNQISLRKLLAYSSINHIGWMLASMMNFKLIWWIYFLIYSIITFNLISIFWSMNVFSSKQLFLIFKAQKLLGFFFSLNFMSLGGLPPFMGFLPKWLTINNLIEQNMFMLATILIISTLITLYFYIRLTFTALVLSKKESILTLSAFNKFFIIVVNSVSLMGLFICTLILNLY